MTILTMVRGDDWEGIYIDGKLVSEGHSHDTVEAIKLALKHTITSVETKYADSKWLDDEGNLPTDLRDVKLEMP